MTCDQPTSSPEQPGDPLATQVTLIVPPDPQMSRVVRLTASALAASAGLTVDAVDDVKIAVSEMLALLVSRGSADAVTMAFAVSPGQLVVEMSSDVPPFDGDDPDLELANLVLDAVTTHHETTHDGSAARVVASVSSPVA